MSNLSPLCKTTYNDDIYIDQLIRESDAKSNKTNQSTKDPEKIALARYYQLLGMLFLMLSCSIIKILVAQYSENSFPFFSYLSLRFFAMSFFFLLLIKRENCKLESLFEIKSIKWMIIRIISWFVNYWGYTMAVAYLKFGLATLILMIAPILQNILYSIHFNIRLNMKYIYPCLISFIGVYIIFSNGSDNQVNQKEEIDLNINLLIGFTSGFLCMIAVSYLFISVKFLNTDYDSNNLNYISSFWCGVLSIIFLFMNSLSELLNFFNLKFVILILIIVYLSGMTFYYLNLAVITADIAKTSYLWYLQLPVLALFGVIFYGERYSLGEVVGFVVILLTLLYTSKYVK